MGDSLVVTESLVGQKLDWTMYESVTLTDGVRVVDCTITVRSADVIRLSGEDLQMQRVHIKILGDTAE